MSIGKRVEDSLALHGAGRFEGALLLALIAAAATARKETPDRNVGDRDCFAKFLGKSTGMSRIAGVEFRGEVHSIPHIFYKWLRCELVHEGRVPMDIEFVGDPRSQQLSLRAGGAPHFVLQLSHGWTHELLKLVRQSPANRGEFEEGHRTIA